MAEVDKNPPKTIEIRVKLGYSLIIRSTYLKVE
jgi:hypothetical protein